ncbi:MAG: response regulator [Granulosicoccus sp.]
MNSEIKVLVVEDNSDDFEMLRRSIRRAQLFDLTWVRSATEGLTELRANHYSVVLLDLSLPDSHGLESVVAFTELATTPVVVLSGNDDESTALESVQHGAHDYLVKGKFDTPLISRTLRYAIERYRLVEELRQTQLQVRREREMRRLESEVLSSSQGGMTISGDTNPLKTVQADVFVEAVARYGELIDKALELRNYKVNYNLSAKLRLLADTLGASRAAPRDIVHIHTAALGEKLGEMTARRRAACNEEARYLLTGLLGHLCLFYQRACLVQRGSDPERNSDPLTDLASLGEQV